MIEAYKIAVNMTLTGDAQKKMLAFSKLVEKTSKQMNTFLRMLKGIGSSFSYLKDDLTFGARALRQFDESLIKTGRDATRVKSSIDGLKRSVAGLGAGGAGIRSGGGFGRGIGLGAAAAGLGRIIIPAGAAYGAYNFGKKSFEANVDFQKYFTQLAARGYNPGQIADIKQFSTSQNIPGVSYTDMAEAYVDALMATASPRNAKFLAPTLARGAAYAQGTYGGMTGKQLQDLIRFAEFRGHGDAAKIKEQLQLGFQVMALSGGSIKPSDLRHLVSYGGGAASKLTNQSLLGLEPILQMRGGSRLGTALQTLYLQLIGGQMSIAKGKSLTSLGLYDTNAIQYSKGGRVLGSKFGKFKYAEQVQTNPFGFLMETYLPALAEQGINKPGAIEQRIQYDFTRAGSQILIAMYENSAKIIRTLGQAGLLQKGSSMYNNFMRTPAGVQTRFTKSWQNLQIAFGRFASPAVISGMNMLASLFESLGSQFNKQSQINKGNVAGGKWKNFFMPWISASKSEGQLMAEGNATSVPASTNSNGGGIKGVYLDSHRVGDVIFGHNSGNQMVSSGALSILPAYHGLPNSSNILGGGFSP